MTPSNKERPVLGHGVLHPGARPMDVIADKEGCMWLCDKGIDPDKSLDDQGCWRCKDLAFTRVS